MPRQARKMTPVGLAKLYELDQCRLSITTLELGRDGVWMLRQGTEGKFNRSLCRPFDRLKDQVVLSISQIVGTEMRWWDDLGMRPTRIIHASINGSNDA